MLKANTYCGSRSREKSSWQKQSDWIVKNSVYKIFCYASDKMQSKHTKFQKRSSENNPESESRVMRVYLYPSVEIPNIQV